MKHLALLALVALPLCLFGLGAIGLLDPDEGRYAEIPREMLEHRDFVTPTLNGVEYFEKPPLLYWLVAASFSVFGQTEGAARLVPALSALLAIAVTWRLGRRMFGERAGLIGAVILATSLMFAFLARALVIDMLFTALVLSALALWWCGRSERGWRAWCCDAGFWIALALAILAKGPVALVLAGGTIGVYALLCRRGRELARPSLLLTLPLLPLIAAPWFLLMSARHPEFNHFYWYQQHIGRFLGESGGHENNVLYLLVRLPALFFPWSLFVPLAIHDGWRRLLPADTERRRAAIFLLGGALFVTLFFSVSSGKVATYVLPAFPLVALPLGAWFDGRLERGAAAWTRPLRAGGLLVAAVLLAASIVLAWEGPDLLPAAAVGANALTWASASLLAAAGLAVGTTCALRRLAGLVGCVAGSVVLLVVGFVFVAQQLGDSRSIRGVVEHIRPGLEAGAGLVTCSGYTPGLCFYTQRRVPVNGRVGELDFGRNQMPLPERESWFLDDRSAAVRQLAVDEPVYCVMDDHEAALKLLPECGPGVREIVWNDRSSILGNAAAAALTPPMGYVLSPPLADASGEPVHSSDLPGRN
jgi:4-amino-4-deoxy-L-arabinose transferase-like glycosyltransferase